MDTLKITKAEETIRTIPTAVSSYNYPYWNQVQSVLLPIKQYVIYIGFKKYLYNPGCKVEYRISIILDVQIYHLLITLQDFNNKLRIDVEFNDEHYWTEDNNIYTAVICAIHKCLGSLAKQAVDTDLEYIRQIDNVQTISHLLKGGVSLSNKL